MSRLRFNFFKVVTLLGLSISQGYCQEFSSKQFKIDNGLPTNVIYDVETDKKGYLWFTSDLGLIKFNGRKFHHYTNADGLAENENFIFRKDNFENLWVIGHSHLLSIIKDGVVSAYKFNDSIKSNISHNSNPVDLFIDSNNTVHYSTVNSNVITIDSTGNTLQHMPVDVQGLIKLENRQYFRTSPSKYDLDSSERKRLYRLKIDNGIRSIELDVSSENRGRSFLEVNDKLFFQYDITKLRYFDGEGIKGDLEFGSRIICLHRFDSLILVGTMKGLFVFNHTADNPVSFRLNNVYGSVTGIASDFENNLWVSTLRNGIFYLKRKKLKSLDIEIDPQDNISKIQSFNNSFYLGTTKGNIWKYEGDSCIKIPSIFYHNSGGISSIQKWNDTLFVYGYEKNVAFLSNGNMNWLYEEPLPGRVKKSEKSSEYNILIGARARIYSRGGNISKSSVLEKTYANSVFIDPSNVLWIGSIYGLFKYSIKNDSIEKVNLRSDIAQVSVDNIFRLTSNKFALSTNNFNSYIFNTTSSKIESSFNDLGINKINNCLFRNGYIFLATNNGVRVYSYMDSVNVEFLYKIDVSDGMESNVIKDICVVDNNLFIATVSNIYYCSYKDWQPDFVPAKIGDINLSSDKKVLINGGTVKGPINKLNLFFEGISFIDPNHLDYFYKLEPIENDWLKTNSNRVVYSNVGQGKYTLFVKVVNRERHSNKYNVSKLSFQVLPPFYKTIWFYFLVVGLVLVIGYFLFKWRVFILNQRAIAFEKEEKEKAQLELQALRAQMNPHFLFNTLNSIQFYIGNKSPQIGQSYLAKFSKLMRRILDFSTKSQVPLEDEISSLNLYLELEQLRFEGKLDISLDYEGIDLDENIYIPTMLIQPFIENAIIHGLQKGTKDGKILVKFEVIDDELYCFVEDNGVGRKESENIKKESGHKSVGMFVSRRRIEVLNQKSMEGGNIKVIDLTDSAGKAIGTKVSVCFGKISKLHEL